MKFCTPQIVWHDKDPVYSIDFHHVEGEEWRLASGGTDKDIKVLLFRNMISNKTLYIIAFTHRFGK